MAVKSLAGGAVVAAMLAVLAGPASAQQGFAGAMSGFSSDNNEPINIEADALEVRDADKIAIFTGNVVVKQGETVLRTKRLKVIYTGSAQGDGDQDIERLEAEGRVVVTSGDQKATGNRGTFDAANDKITLAGSVVLSQGENVIRGDTLLVDLAAGTSRMLSKNDGRGRRVQGLFVPSQDAPSQ